jgi:hypothetical protein
LECRQGLSRPEFLAGSGELVGANLGAFTPLESLVSAPGARGKPESRAFYHFTKGGKLIK